MQSKKLLILVLWLALSLSLPLMAQRYQSHIYTEDNGLPSSLVLDINQDSFGYMWFTTRSGVARYDGSRWTIFNGYEGLDTNIFKRVRSDGHGGVYVGNNLASKPIFHWDGRSWTGIDGPDAKLKSTVAFGLEVVVWEGESVLALLYGDAGLFLLRHGLWSQPLGSNSQNIYQITSYDNQIVVASSEGLLLVGPNGVNSSLNDLIPPAHREVTGAVVEDGPQGPVYWLHGKERLGRISGSLFTDLCEVPTSYWDEAVMLADTFGGVFFGRDDVLSHYARGKAKTLGMESGLVGSGVTSLFRDRENNVWVSSLRGVSKIPSQRFTNYNEIDGMFQREVSALLELRPGLILAGHNRGLSLYDGEQFSTFDLTSQEPGLRARVMDLEPDGNGGAWAACSAAGLYHFRVEEDATGYVLKVSEHFPLEAPSDMAVALCHSKGELLLGTSDALMRIRQGRLVYDSNLRGINVRRLYTANDGKVYAATVLFGLLIRQQGQWKKHPAWEKEDGEIYSLWQDKEGRLLIGTLGGLLQLDEDGVAPFHIPHSDLQRPVYTLLEDASGHIWAGTDRGVFRLDEDKWRHYSAREGLTGNELNRDAAVVDYAGHVWFGTDQGMSSYWGEKDITPLAPLVEMGTIEVNGQSANGESLARLSHKENELVFNFHILGFTDESSTRFSCRLDGYDSVWLAQTQNSDRSMRYTNLAPGNYRFHVKAAHATGEWSEDVSSLPITIEKAYWSTLWFRLLLFGAVLAFLYSAFDYLSSKRLSQDLEVQVKERTHALEGKIHEHQVAQAQIRALNELLEERVAERTAELESAQRDLVETAHRAGMAEIATSMLHNVGNVLNSVGTSSFLLKEALAKSALGSFHKANQLLETNIEDLVNYVTHEPKAKQLFQFYLSLGERLQKEHDQMNTNLVLLLERLETIKGVVAEQHNYASGVYQTEEVELCQLVKSSISILSSNLESRRITVDTQFDPVPKLLLRKTRLIHTLVNLIKNAAESIDEAEPAEKRITITLCMAGEDICLRIRDTGMGIDEETQAKIFRHGFSTKTTGMGFGLHSCANAMQEMGGSIQVESPGLKQGAIFLLTFPLEAPAQRQTTTPN